MNNKGFTMVEIIVVLAMGAIVSAVIGQTFVGNFKSYSNMSITQIQTMALNDVNEILNEQVEDAMDVSVIPASSNLDDDEYGIYTDMSGNLQLKHSGNVMTLYTSDTGAINILELYVLKDVFEMDQLQFNLNYNSGDGSDNLISRTLTTQLFNDSSVDYNGIGYNGSNDEYLLRNDADMLVFKKAIDTALPLDPDAILSYYLSDPSFTVDDDPQTYIFGMLYWDGDEYQVFNNMGAIYYGDDDLTTNYVPTIDEILDNPSAYTVDDDSDDGALLVRDNEGNNYKFAVGAVVNIEGKYYVRVYPDDGNKGADITEFNNINKDNTFDFFDARWKLIDETTLVTFLSSERQWTVDYESVLPADSPTPSTDYEIGDMVYAGTSLYWYDGEKFIKLDDLYNEDRYPGLIVTKDDIFEISDNILDFNDSVSYGLQMFVKVTYDDGLGYDFGHKEIFKKVVTGEDTNPGNESDRIDGGWQLQSNQYDPYSVYVSGDQAMIFGDNNDEIYVISFTATVGDSDDNGINDAFSGVYNCYINNSESYTGTGYTISKYIFELDDLN